MNPSTQYNSPHDAGTTASPVASSESVDKPQDLMPHIQRMMAQLQMQERNYNRLANRVRELETRLALINQRIN